MNGRTEEVKRRMEVIRNEIAEIGGIVSRMRPAEARDVKIRVIGEVLPVFFWGGRNSLYNMSFREDATRREYEEWIASLNGSAHGYDAGNPPAEMKSVTFRSRKITASTPIGEIDKIHQKIRDERYRNSEFIFGLFRPTESEPFLVLRISSDDFVENVLPNLARKAEEYRHRTENISKRSGRDSYKVTFGEIARLSSFRVVFVEKDSESDLGITTDALNRIAAKEERRKIAEGLREVA